MMRQSVSPSARRVGWPWAVTAWWSVPARKCSGCPALPFDDTDYVAEEVLSSLELREVVADEHATVVASFTAEGTTHRVQWVLRNVDGSWKISDIFSMSKDWALSRFQCE